MNVRLRNGTLAMLVAVALLGGCSRPNSDVGDLEGTNPYGVSEADYEAGAEREQTAIKECMEDFGWPYSPEDPDDLIVSPAESGPAWGHAEVLIRAHDDSVSMPEPTNPGIPASVRVQDHQSWMQQAIQCSESAFDESDRRRREASQSFQLLDRAWEVFWASDEYANATQEWKRCMQDVGYDVTAPERVDEPIGEQILAILHAPGFDPKNLDKSELLTLQRHEIALFDADQKCRSDTIAPVEASFKRRLLTEHAEAAEAIRRAIRND